MNQRQIAQHIKQTGGCNGISCHGMRSLGALNAGTPCPFYSMNCDDDLRLVEVADQLLAETVVRITVRGGVAEIESCPEGIEVVITDYDNEG